ncbi:MAG: hypothetical protein J6D30_03375 [Clostridia bacterium]|nr:hypothetical protein [Clostridia bacterium]
MIKTPKRTAVFICNIIISLLCILSIAMYFIQPLWKADITYTLSGDVLAEMVGGAMEEGDSENSDSPEINLDLEDITIHMSITLHTQDILASLGDNPTEGVQHMIDENVNTLIDQLTADLDTIVESLLKSVSKQAVSSTVKDQVHSAMGGDKSTEEVDQVLQDAGITDQYIDQKTEELIDSLYAENATVDSVTEDVITIVEDVFDKLSNTELEEFQEPLTEEAKEEIRDSVSEILSSMADENGNLNIDDMLLESLLGMLNGETPEIGGGSEGGPEDGPEDGPLDSSSAIGDSVDSMKCDISAKMATPMNDVSSEGGDSSDKEPMTKEEMIAELKAKLSTEIKNMIPEDLASQIADVMKIISYVLLFTFFTWAYLILKILAKMMRTNNAIKVGLPIWLGCLPFLVLYAIPTAIFSVIANPPTAMVEMLPPDVLQSMAGLSITITSGSVFSFIAEVVLALLAIFYYGGLRRYLKKVEKGKIIIEEPQPAPKAETVAKVEPETQQPTPATETATADATNTTEETDTSENK